MSSLKLKSIPAFIRIANDQQSLEMALVENIQRENLDPIEIALCYQRLIDDVKLTQEQMSSRVGKKRSTISNYLRLLKLDPIIQTGIRDGFISMGHGRTLVTIENRDDQLKIYKKILSDSLSVRETENIRNRLKSDSKEISIVKKKLPEPFKSNLNKLKNPFFIAELSANHNGSLKNAKKLICSKSTLSWCAALLSEQIETCYFPEYVTDTVTCKYPILNTKLY